MKNSLVLVMLLALNGVMGSPPIKITPTIPPPSQPPSPFEEILPPLPNNRVFSSEYNDFYPVTARDYKGNIYVAAQVEKPAGDFDIVVYRSEDNGKTWADYHGANWPLVDGRWNNQHPHMAIGPRNDIWVVTDGKSPDLEWPDALYFMHRKENDVYWRYWNLDFEMSREWYKNCSYPVIAVWPQAMDTLLLWIAFQYNKDDGDTDIWSWCGYYRYSADTMYMSSLDVLKGVPVVENPEVKEGRPSMALYVRQWVGEITHPLIAYEYGNETKDIKIIEGDTLDYGPPLYDAPLTLAGDPEVDERHPWLAADSDYFYCAYTSGDDAYVAYSTDKGRNFISTEIDTNPGVHHRPVVVCHKDKVGVAYYDRCSPDSGNVLYRYSPDNGQTWTVPETVSTKTTVVDTERIAMSGCSHIIWVDKRNMDSRKWDIYHGRPRDTIPEHEPPGVLSLPIKKGKASMSIKPTIFKTEGLIEYQTSTPGLVSLDIYNPAGRLVKNLVDTYAEPGVFRIIWNGKDSEGLKVPSGVYFVSLKTKEMRHTKRVVLIK